MSQANICRFCINICHDYKHLYADSEVYEIIVKYFDPEFLGHKKFTAVCFECWCHIVDFHNFQQTVIMAQSRLDDDDYSIMNSIVEECNAINSESVTIKQEPSPEFIFLSDSPCSTGEEFMNIETDFEPKDHKSSFLVKHVPEAKIPSQKNTKDPQRATSDGRQFTYPNIFKSESSPVSDGGSFPNTTTALLLETFDRPQKKNNTAEDLDRIIARWRPTLDCRICKKSFSNFTLLHRHFSDQHPSREFFVWCCDRKYALRSRLEEHLRSHTDHCYKCDSCGRPFKWRVTLARHVRKCPQYLEAHSNIQRSFKCDECGEVLDSASALHRHEAKKHTAGRFKCKLCVKSYTAISSLREHMSSHTGKDLYECELCAMTFQYRSQWRLHRIREHLEGQPKAIN